MRAWFLVEESCFFAIFNRASEVLLYIITIFRHPAALSLQFPDNRGIIDSSTTGKFDCVPFEYCILPVMEI